MATRKKLEILISAVDEASRELKEIEKELKGVDDAAKKSDKSTQGFGSQLGSLKVQALAVAGTVAALGVVMKKAFELGKEGAALEYTADKFDNLSACIGTTSAALKRDLSEATGGLVAESKLVADATDLMSLGLVKTHDEAVRLTTVAGQLGMDMNQLTLTLSNQTTMRFDSLGVSVDGFDERLKALKDTGMDVNDAFKEAFLQQAEEQVKKVGDVADSSMSAFMRLDKAAADLSDTVKLYLSPAMQGIADVLASTLTNQNNYISTLQQLKQALDSDIISLDEYRDILYLLQNGMSSHEEVIARLTQAEIDHTAAMVAAHGTQEITINKNLEVAASTETAAASTVKYTDELTRLKGEQENIDIQVASEIERQGAAFQSATLNSIAYIDSMKNVAAIDIARDSMNRLEEAISNTDSSTVSGQEMIEAYRTELYETALQSGIWTEAQIAQAQAQDAVWSAIENNTISLGNYGEAALLAFEAVKTGEDPLNALNEKFGIMSGTVIPDNEAAYMRLANTTLPNTKKIMDEFTGETLGGLRGGFEETTQTAGGLIGEVNGVGTALDKLDGRTAKTYVYTYHIDVGGSGGAQTLTDQGSPGGAGLPIKRPGGASGLSMIVPGNYQGDSFLFGANSGERVTIETRDQQRTNSGGSGGGGGGFTFVYAPQVSMGDTAEVEQVIAPAIERVYRKLVREDAVRMR